MDLSLNGKTAVVCGATQGIGKAIALELAHLGASVVLVARNEISLKSVVSELPIDKNQDHKYLVADFSKPANVKQVIDEYIDNGGEAHILVNNTGGPAPGALIDEDYQKINDTMSAHLQCNHQLVQALVPSMKTASYGRVINVVSTSVYMPIPGLGVSNTVRGAVASWAKTLSFELAGFGITVNNVLPGLTKTARLDSLLEKTVNESGLSASEVEVNLCKTIPAGRFGDANEVANLAAFLASPAAGYINGTSIAVDGGKTGSI